VTLVVAVLVPMIVFAGIVLVVLGRQQRAAVETGAVETARALVNAADESLLASVKVLEALAISRTLDTGDLRAFHAEARRAVATQPAWSNPVLLSSDGRQIVNTTREFGEALPRVVEPVSFAAATTASPPGPAAATSSSASSCHPSSCNCSPTVSARDGRSPVRSRAKPCTRPSHARRARAGVSASASRAMQSTRRSTRRSRPSSAAV
jgi:hypothetical protein